jgi:hypothetical protein
LLNKILRAAKVPERNQKEGRASKKDGATLDLLRKTNRNRYSPYLFSISAETFLRNKIVLPSRPLLEKAGATASPQSEADE